MGSCPVGELSWWGVVPLGKCLVGSGPSGNLSRWELSRVGICSGGGLGLVESCPGGGLD